ncbi:hypothetical protein G4B88_026799 [Cannabis sativa]|uniref:Uncharacterized protein n=1 Tax=Cannabis sativa TaxID=3483 RepID=A0A7J6F9C9_CANSA|nr:hypothetical protein G4B88_026799 [Cannabis sativa]
MKIISQQQQQQQEGPFNLKSNLKKTVVNKDNQSSKLEEEEAKIEKRKVTWPDAHGDDIAHVQEFEPSVSEDGELEGVRNSCMGISFLPSNASLLE